MTLSEIYFEAMNNADTRDKDTIYSIYKKEIQKLNFTSEEYQDAIQKLCEYLNYNPKG